MEMACSNESLITLKCICSRHRAKAPSERYDNFAYVDAFSRVLALLVEIVPKVCKYIQ